MSSAASNAILDRTVELPIKASGEPTLEEESTKESSQQSDAENEEAVLRMVELDFLDNHPLNPRLALRDEVINSITGQVKDEGFRNEYALLVRPSPYTEGRFEIINGHHRREAARRAGIHAIPCWVRVMNDDEAYMQLVLGNAQDALTLLEIGIHARVAIEKGAGGRGVTGGIRAYARRLGKNETTIRLLKNAAEVYETASSSSQFDGKVKVLEDKTRHLSCIFNAPDSAWPALCAALSKGILATYDETEKAVKRVKELHAAIPEWWGPLDLSELATTAITQPQEAARLMRGFAASATVASQMSPVTVEGHEDDSNLNDAVTPEASAEISLRDERQLHLFQSTPKQFNAADAFKARITQCGLPTSESVRDVERGFLEEMRELSNINARGISVLSDAELALQTSREQRERDLDERNFFTPEVIHGDAMIHLRERESGSVSLVCVDPPYNMGKADWDKLGTGEEYAAWARPWLQDCHRILKDDGAIYIFGNYTMLRHVHRVMEEIGFQFRRDIIWDYIQGSGHGLWNRRHDTILYFSKSDHPYEDAASVRLERHEDNIRESKGVVLNTKDPGDIWRFPTVDSNDPERTGHITQKPLALIERIIKASCPREGIVLDPFVGSGTTLRAAMRTRRRSIGIELDAGHIEIIKDTIERTIVGEAIDGNETASSVTEGTATATATLATFEAASLNDIID